MPLPPAPNRTKSHQSQAMPGGLSKVENTPIPVIIHSAQVDCMITRRAIRSRDPVARDPSLESQMMDPVY